MASIAEARVRASIISPPYAPRQTTPKPTTNESIKTTKSQWQTKTKIFHIFGPLSPKTSISATRHRTSASSTNSCTNWRNYLHTTRTDRILALKRQAPSPYPSVAKKTSSLMPRPSKPTPSRPRARPCTTSSHGRAHTLRNCTSSAYTMPRATWRTWRKSGRSTSKPSGRRKGTLYGCCPKRRCS